MKYAAAMYATAMMAILVLAGCSKPKDVAYYKSHSAERAKRVEACESSGDASDDCRNAKQGETEAYDDAAVAYYKTHPAALAKRIDECAGNPSHDCSNAKLAQSAVGGNQAESEAGGKQAQPISSVTSARK